MTDGSSSELAGLKSSNLYETHRKSSCSSLVCCIGLFFFVVVVAPALIVAFILLFPFFVLFRHRAQPGLELVLTPVAKP